MLTNPRATVATANGGGSAGRIVLNGGPHEPVHQPSPGPRTPAQPSTERPPGGDVTPVFVANRAAESLPKETDFQEYLKWARTGLPTLRDQVLAKAAVDQAAFTREMTDGRDQLRQLEKALNTKSTSAKVPFSARSLPGVAEAGEFRSVFEATDLALSQWRSVRAKRFYFPVVFPEAMLSPSQTWRFGQKLEYRQEWRHQGFTLGELISSLSLLPDEELRLEVSSWQRTKSEIESVQEEETRNQLEREQRRTDEESASLEAAHSEGWSVSATGSISYGPVSASVEANATSNTETRSQTATRHVSEATSKASTELSLRRAVKITQTAEAGSESRTTRTIRNPNSCHTVTYNFFQIVKLHSVRMRLENDAPTVMLPGLFPSEYDDSKPVSIPYDLLESFTSPANFLTQYFEVDRDLSEDIYGWGLRVRCNAWEAPELALAQVAEALVVAAKFLLRLDPATQIDAIAKLVSAYARAARKMRAVTLAEYQPEGGRTEQLTTTGIYADSMLGRCTAGEDYVESSRFLDITRQQNEISSLSTQTQLAAQEVQRRQKLLAANNLEPFGSEPSEPA